MPKLVLSIAAQSADARPVRERSKKTPKTLRVIERAPAPSEALKAALAAVEAFGKAPAYKRRNARRGVSHA